MKKNTNMTKLEIFIEFLIISFFTCPQIAAEHYLSTYKDKEDVQHRITEVVSTTITPLEWKANAKKENEFTKNMDIKNVEAKKESREEDLPF